MAAIGQYVGPDVLAEANSWQFTGVLRDDEEAAIPLSGVGTLTLTLYDKATAAVINSVTNVDIKNTGRGTIHATSGALAIHFLPEDTPITVSTLTEETHVALIKGTYNGGADKLNFEIVHRVRNVRNVP
jgi:hydrogenase maturation factor